MYPPIRCDCGREVGPACMIIQAIRDEKISDNPVPYLRMIAQDPVSIGEEMTNLGFDPVHDMCCRKTIMTYQEIHKQ